MAKDTYSNATTNPSRCESHFLIKEIAGYLLHPTISTHEANLRIADVGNGTGIWACDVSKNLPPTVQIDDFDISAAQFPAADSRPQNVHLYTHDGFEDYTTEFHEQYDIVHARFWLCIVNDPDAGPLPRKLLSLLMDGTAGAGCGSGGYAGGDGVDDCVGKTL
ncbi:hypothetical protein H4I95_06584 [Botrytis cinerea]